MSSLGPDATREDGGVERSRVMISSIMRGRESDRAMLARVIEEESDEPWYADKPPHQFRNIPAETVSFQMAEDCDLYLLVIFPRYGTVVFPDDPRSVTHQEFDHARGVNPYKVEVFISEEAEASEDAALLDFIKQARDFRDGYSPHTFQSLAELLEQAREALMVWRAGGATGRNAFAKAVADEYRLFHNPVTGK